jgi:type I restriction enzyme S subunit
MILKTLWDMNEWKEYKFSDFVELNPTVKIPKDSQISFVEMKDLEDGKRFCFPSQERELSGGSKFQNYDTLFARITPCLENGKICQVKGLKNNVGFGSTEFHVFRGKNDTSDSNFIFYLSRWKEVRDHAEMNFDGTSGRQRVPRQSFDDLILNLPPLHEQTAIASVLGSLDDKIDLLHRQNATLEKMAETLFRQWFVEEAKEEWEFVKMESLISIGSGKGLKKESFIENGLYPILGANGEIGKTNEFLFDERLIYT